MDKRSWYLLVAFVLIAFLPLVRHLIRMRIIILKWMRWKWLADFNERHFDRLVLISRIILIAIAMILIIIAFVQ